MRYNPEREINEAWPLAIETWILWVFTGTLWHQQAV